jgi:hypothetical protein
MTALATIIEVLTPLSPEERTRTVHAALVMLGEPIPVAPTVAATAYSDDDFGDLSPRARAWMKQNLVTVEHLQQVFHMSDGAIDVIAAQLSGRNKKEQTYSAYILTGIAQLLVNGVPTFDDKAARSFCEAAGCYDVANHANTLKEKGNAFTGSKDKGWTLTSPGLKRGADLIKDMNKLNA